MAVSLTSVIGSPLLKAPVSIVGLPLGSGEALTGMADFTEELPGTEYTTTTYNVWTDGLSVTGKGVIHFAGCYTSQNGSNSIASGYRLLIDDVVVAQTATDYLTPAMGSNLRGIHFIGHHDTGNNFLGFEQVPFNSSFKMQFIKGTNVGGTLGVTCGAQYALIP